MNWVENSCTAQLYIIPEMVISRNELDNFYAFRIM